MLEYQDTEAASDTQLVPEEKIQSEIRYQVNAETVQEFGSKVCMKQKGLGFYLWTEMGISEHLLVRCGGAVPGAEVTLHQSTASG